MKHTLIATPNKKYLLVLEFLELDKELAKVIKNCWKYQVKSNDFSLGSSSIS